MWRILKRQLHRGRMCDPVFSAQLQCLPAAAAVCFSPCPALLRQDNTKSTLTATSNLSGLLLRIKNMNLQSIQKCLLQANTSYIVKNECLSNLSELFRDQTILQDPSTQSDVRAIVKLLRDFSHYHDPRVRSAALTSLVRHSLIL